MIVGVIASHVLIDFLQNHFVVGMIAMVNRIVHNKSLFHDLR